MGDHGRRLRRVLGIRRRTMYKEEKKIFKKQGRKRHCINGFSSLYGQANSLPLLPFLLSTTITCPTMSHYSLKTKGIFGPQPNYDEIIALPNTNELFLK